MLFLLFQEALITFITDQLREELLAIEADTYADFVRTGRLNQELPLFLNGEVPELKS